MIKKRPDISAILRAFWILVRWPNLFLLVFTQYLTKICLIDQKQNWLTEIRSGSLFILSLSTVLIAAGGYIINDYYDVKIDLINKPNRVMIGRFIKRRWALGLHQLLSFTGVMMGLLLSKKVFAINVIVVFLLWLYANQLKRTAFWGNLLVALLTALSLVVLAVYYQQHQQEVYAFAGFSFFISLIREILKDMEDVKGDENFGCKTLPIIWGIRKTKWLIYFIILLFTALIISTTILVKGMFLTSLCILPLALLVYWLVPADTRKAFTQLSTLCKYIMLLGVLSMVLI
jgi:4-hydroxybenzoate polyprenyltransferase